MNLRITYVMAGLLGSGLMWTACDRESGQAEAVDTPAVVAGLHTYYKDYFRMGVSVEPDALQGDQAELITREFASLTAENVMKMGPIHPAPDRFNWGPADRVVEFAREHHMAVRGHALCWHNQAPGWLFVDEAGGTVSKAVLLQRLQSHIDSVAGRYREDIYAWDVVNEAISDQADEVYRHSPWYQICGPDFIAEAFRYAHAAAPEAELFYNDYEVINPTKRQKIYEMVKGLVEAGVPIHGVGIQGHWSVYEPTEAELRKTLDLFTGLGLKVQITELDVSVYKKEHSLRERRPTDVDDFTPELQAKQVAQYEMIFRVFREYGDKLNAVTFWNISDRHSWLDEFPVPGRKDYPLLFDENLEPKTAYRAITDFQP